MRQRNVGLSVDAGLSVGYFRLCVGNGSEEQLRSGEGGVEAEEQARATPEASWREKAKRRVAICVVGTFDICWCFLAVRYPFRFIL